VTRVVLFLPTPFRVSPSPVVIGLLFILPPLRVFATLAVVSELLLFLPPLRVFATLAVVSGLLLFLPPFRVLPTLAVGWSTPICSLRLLGCCDWLRGFSVALLIATCQFDFAQSLGSTAALANRFVTSVPQSATLGRQSATSGPCSATLGYQSATFNHHSGPGPMRAGSVSQCGTARPGSQAVDFVLQGPQALSLATRWQL